MHRELIAIAAAALAAAATSAPAARAADVPGMGKDIAYDVNVEGQGKYTYSERIDRGGAGEWDGHDVDLTFTYGGEITDGVVFRNASPLDTTGDDIPQGAATGTYVHTGNGGASPACEVDAGFDPVSGWMRMVDDADLDLIAPLDGSMDLWIRPLDRFDVLFDCPGEDSHPGVSLVLPALDDDLAADGTIKMGHNPFDIRFNLPKDVVGMGQIQQLDPARVIEGVACPGSIADQTTTCRLEWTAKVTLTKLWEKAAPSSSPAPAPQDKAPAGKDDDLLLPLVAVDPVPDEDLLVPLVPQGKASLSADASKASFSVSCTGGCTGTASLTAGSGAGTRAATAARRPLARARFTVPRTGARKVTIRLGAKARSAVRRAGGARIAVRLTARGHTATRTLTLRLPRRPSHR
jgi:hypothetical protein